MTEEIAESVAALADDMAVVERLAAARYTCRGYRPQPVPKVLIHRMLACAQRSATWCNTQPWKVIVLEGEATRRFADALFEHASSDTAVPRPDIDFPGPYVGVYDERRKDVGKQLYAALGIGKGDRDGSRRQALENFRLFGAPHVAIVTTERDLGTYGVLDCGFYLGNLLLAAQSLGIATTAQASIARYGDFVKKYFEIPTNRILLCGVAFGWPDPDHPANQFRTPRANLNDVVDYRCDA